MNNVNDSKYEKAFKSLKELYEYLCDGEEFLNDTEIKYKEALLLLCEYIAKEFKE